MSTNLNIPNWDWNKKLPIDIWHKLIFDGFPEWEVDYRNDGDNLIPSNIILEVVHKTDRSSRDIAVEADDWLEGYFYYRDFTDDTLPFVDEGETYRSCFWFQLEEDATEFQKRYGGELA